ncbi:MAG: SDR family NAD(P)-dependent oxidoreductase [Polyangiales bacterium]
MSYEVKDRVIVITGATGGLGRAAAEALRNKGAKLALLDLDKTAVETMAADFGDSELVAGWAADVRSMQSLQTAMDAIATHFGGIDVVIAGAGVGFSSSFEGTDPNDFDRIIDINLNGVWRTFRTALPYVKKRRGYLLAVSSMAAFIHSPLNAHYSASKAGVWAVCNSIRLELKHLGVDVGSLHPTFFPTPMLDDVLDDPLSTLVWNNHKGIWKQVTLEEVVDALVGCVECRREIVTVPSRNQIVANSPGFARKLVEKIGFDDERVVQAIKLSDRLKDNQNSSR